MRSVKTLIKASALSCACLFSSLAYAGEALYIVNNTDKPITTLIHGSRGPECSTKILKDNGVSWPKQTHKITAVQLKIACRKVESNCYADVFLTNNCGADGSKTQGFARININEGVTEAKMNEDSDYQVKYVPGTFRVEISEKN